MLHFAHASRIAAPVEAVFAFHERPDALELLTPPWQRVRVVRREGGLRAGAVVEFRIVVLGPLSLRWVAEHVEYRRHELFVDEQREGPFAAWRHRHLFERDGDGTRLTDSIEYGLRGGRVAEWAGGWFVERQLRRMFAYRHEVTRRECERG